MFLSWILYLKQNKSFTGIHSTSITVYKELSEYKSASLPPKISEFSVKNVSCYLKFQKTLTLTTTHQRYPSKGTSFLSNQQHWES